MPLVPPEKVPVALSAPVTARPVEDQVPQVPPLPKLRFDEPLPAEFQIATELLPEPFGSNKLAPLPPVKVPPTVALPLVAKTPTTMVLPSRLVAPVTDSPELADSEVNAPDMGVIAPMVLPLIGEA